MSTRCLSIALALIVALYPAALPAQADRLYEASVPVRDQSAEARRGALRGALGAVLVKLTGDREVAQRESVAPILDAASRLVQQYRYEQVEDLEGVRVLHLRARFDPVALQGALAERRVATWGRERPLALAWVAFDDGFERGFVDATAPPAIRGAVEEAALARGLPLVWPLFDLEDRAALPFTDLWGGFEERIGEASERYRSNAVLVGRIYRVDDERWAARWTLLDDQGSTWTESGPAPLAEVAAAGPHWLADRYAERFALEPGAADGRTRVVVIGVNRVGDYAGVMRYLASLSPVAHVALDSVDRDEVTFALELRGTPQQLQQAIALGRRLTPAGEPQDYDPTLRYALRR